MMWISVVVVYTLYMDVVHDVNVELPARRGCTFVGIDKKKKITQFWALFLNNFCEGIWSVTVTEWPESVKKTEVIRSRVLDVRNKQCVFNSYSHISR